MQDLFLLLIVLMFLACGVVVPFVMSLGYLWVDVFSPQDVSGNLLVGQPIAFIFGAAALLTYLLLDRREPPKVTFVTVMQVLLGIWITLTTTWAVVPDIAYLRWNLAIKVLAFAIFLPFVIRTRVQIEAMIFVYLLSIVGHVAPWGLKTVFTGGGYNLSLGLLHVNSNVLGESSAVAGIALMIIPLILALKNDTILFSNQRQRSLVAWGTIMICVVAAVGTFARTALVAAAVMSFVLWLRSKKKIAFMLVGVGLAGVAFAFTSDRWFARIDTISDYQNESSAFVRVLVWKWSFGFLQSHPFGGGFWCNLVSRIEVPGPDGQVVVQFGRAFHNMFVACITEHGYPGFILYMGVIIGVLLQLQKARKLTRALPEHAWCGSMAVAVQVAIITVCSSGMFIESGWAPFLWYLLSLGICLREYARRVAAPAVRGGGVARPMEARATGGLAPVPAGLAAMPARPMRGRA